jgi:hypothetical protein
MGGFATHGSYGYGYRKYGYGAYGGYGHSAKDDADTVHKSAEAASTVTDEE